MERKTLFADVIVPLPVPGLFTYRIPFDLNDSIQPWTRVVIQFGRKKIYTAIVVNIHETPPQTASAKYILSILDAEPIMTAIQFTFWKWMSSYYMCEPGEVMNIAIPSALKLASESRIALNPDFNGDFDALNEKEYLIAEALDIQKQLTLSEIEHIVEQKKVIPLIKTLIEKGLIIVEEELQEKYKPKKVSYIKLTSAFQIEEKLQELFNQLEKRAFKQLEVMMAYINQGGFINGVAKEIKKSAIEKQVDKGSAAITSLVKKGVFEKLELNSSRLEEAEANSHPDKIELSEFQGKANQEIRRQFKDNHAVLLHGITSSGKTEIYIKLIQETLDQGKQILFLLPEIALTTQIINRLRKYFGNLVGVYHSKYNENERVEIWNSVLQPAKNKLRNKIVIGPRSALFLPFESLGLVIVDEEHDYSYKQYDPAPRYNARDGAIYLASLHKAKVILGSATPSIESYFNAKSGKYGLVELHQRYGGIKLPEIFVADLKKETREKTMKSHFSSFLLKHINIALEKKEQVILFQNRRGFSLRLECTTCNWMPECKNCDVTLIYHKHLNQLKCHYCGYSRRVPERCDSCGSTHLSMRGFGTEKIEDELGIFYPDARIRRMDLDTTRSKLAYQNIINDFEEKRIDILVGTQMVTKGLDFDNVSLVGILNADNMISFPDFRSFERSFQLMAQVSGRAGRKNKRGMVIIQTYHPYHAVIRDVIDNNYTSMYQSQVMERRNFKYPPFVRMIRFSLKHKDPILLNEAAKELGILFRDVFKNDVLGPEYPIVSRIRSLYIKNMLIKIERGKNLHENKKLIFKQIENFRTLAKYKSVRIIIDVDPV
jgi:primosomal protein N' (replication factor Y)